MNAAFIRQRPDFNLISYGNGLAYALERKPSYQSIYVQGDDAETFKADLDAMEERWDTDEALARLWRDYQPA